MLSSQKVDVDTDKSVRLRVALGHGVEFEIEGSPDVLDRYDEVVQQLLGKLSSTQVAATPSKELARVSPTAALPAAPVSAVASSGDLPDFGEILHRMPRQSSAVDQILVAAWHVERSKGGQPFSTAEANKLLVEHGIRVANASQSMSNNASRKRVFKTGGGFRVSRDGQDFVKQFLEEGDR